MRNDKDIKELLNKLSETTTESVPPALAEDIKCQIPSRLPHHRMGMDTINIIIHLRINKLAAAAAIIITIIICGTFLDGQNSSGGVIQDGMLFIKHWSRAGNTDISAIKQRYDRLLGRGENVVWYGDQITTKDRSFILIQRKLPDGNYEVMFADGREEKVTAEELIILLSRMLQKKPK